jgi:hypothetical protein
MRDTAVNEQAFLELPVCRTEGGGDVAIGELHPFDDVRRRIAAGARLAVLERTLAIRHCG